jgi:hypothetical protein
VDFDFSKNNPMQSTFWYDCTVKLIFYSANS